MKIPVALFLAFFSLSGLSLAQTSATLTLNKTIALPSVLGRLDHLAFDTAGSRLFVAATGNHTVEVINIKTGKAVETIAGLGKPHGLAWIPERGELYVADGTLAALKVYSGSPFKEVASLPLSDDADDMVYDPATRLLYVGHGGTGAAVPGRIAVVNTQDNSLVQNLAVSAHPEALELDPQGKRVFINIADSSEIVVVDSSSHAIKSTWKLSRAKDNVPIAFDGDDHVLLVGCRTPARALSIESGTGKEVSDLPAAAGADDIFYEPRTHRAYLITGSGTVNVYAVAADKTLKALDSIKTGPGAKTGLLVPSLAYLFVAVPSAGSEPAQIRQYSTQP